MQLRAGVMLPSAKGELSCKQKAPTLHVVAMKKISLLFLIAEYVLKKFRVKEEKKEQALKETPCKKIGQKCCDSRKALKRGN